MDGFFVNPDDIGNGEFWRRGSEFSIEWSKYVTSRYGEFCRSDSQLGAKSSEGYHPNFVMD
jgi:hypothetical protein